VLSLCVFGCCGLPSQAAAAKLCGEHDFRNFCKIDAPNVTHFMRRVDSFTIAPVHDASTAVGGAECKAPSRSDQADPDDLYVMTVRGNAFLWHQVRCMAAVLFVVGSGKDDPSNV